MRLLLLFLFLGSLAFGAEPGPLTLWYDKPAEFTKARNEAGGTYKTLLMQGLPIGNGRMGAVIKGDVSKELIRLSESSLWTGVSNSEGYYTLLGTFQSLGDVTIDLAGQEPYTNYKRSLDLTDATSRVTYSANGITYHREYFCSYPAQVVVVHLTADKPGSYSGAISYTDSHEGVAVIDKNLITDASTLGDASDTKYETQVMVLNEGGSQSISKNEYGDKTEFKNCDSLTLLIAVGTNYVMDFAKHYRGDLPHDRVSQQIQAAVAQAYEDLKAAHVADYQKLFNRVALDLGTSSNAQRAVPMDVRARRAARETDPELEQLMFQYGRYLLISASRPGGIAANSQGVWNDSNVTVFGARYTNDLTSEMPYWPVETANLAECHLPLFDFLQSQIPAWKIDTDKDKEFQRASGAMNTRGFAIRGSSNVMGGMAFWWDKAAAAWYCHHYWEHYAFTQDKDFLAKVAYPIMKEVCQLHEDQLKTLPDGRLVVPHCWSPEHGPWEDGVSYDQEIVWDLFNNYVKACDVLGIDKEYRDKIAGMRDKLAKPGIGSWGQLLEWMTEKKGSNPNGDDNFEGINFRGYDTPADHHRHTSHLWFVYPGSQVSPRLTPDLVAATKVTLVARGNTNNEWNYGWRSAIYARLGDGEAAYDQIQHFCGLVLPNLLAGGGVFQYDGNSAITAAMIEMLLQSQNDSIDLLPALPKAWPDGSVKGLRARGGFEVDESWKAGKLTSATIHSTAGMASPVRYGDKTTQIHLQPGGSVTLDGNLQSTK